jgi:type IX secretion system PorP/SprF family membrane protein
MIVMQKHIITLSLLLCFLTSRSQYNPQFSQLIKTLEFVNPGYNASKTDPSAILIYRNQWVGFDDAPKTYGANINIPVNKWHTGFGVNSLVETRGLITQANTSLNANVDVKITKASYLTFGLNVGIETKNIDLDRAVYLGEPITAHELNTNNFYTGIGLNLFVSNLHLGAGFHYTQLTGNFYNTNEPYSLYINGSYLYYLSNNWTLKPAILFRNFAGYSDLDYGLFVLYKDLVWAGVANRWNQSVIFFADIKITKFIRLGYSYDLGIGENNIANYGTHEVSLEFKLPRSKSSFERNAN